MSARPAAAYQRRRISARGTTETPLFEMPRRADVARHAHDFLVAALEQLGAGERLPNEDELSRSLGVSRNAVREALDLLREEGFLRRVRGAGSFTTEPVMVRRCDVLSNALGDGGFVWRKERDVGYEEISSALIDDLPGLVADGLEFDPNRPVVMIERRSIIDGQPVGLRSQYFAAERLVSEGLDPAQLLANPEDGDLLKRVRARVADTQVTLRAALADPRSAELLEVDDGSALLLLETRASLPSGAPFFVSFGRMPAGRSMLVLEKHSG